jgi:hypothetical protein
MFEALVQLDFSKDCSIKQLVNIPYEIDDDDEDLALN